jgi:hypothetical protein
LQTLSSSEFKFWQSLNRLKIANSSALSRFQLTLRATDKGLQDEGDAETDSEVRESRCNSEAVCGATLFRIVHPTAAAHDAVGARSWAGRIDHQSSWIWRIPILAPLGVVAYL